VQACIALFVASALAGQETHSALLLLAPEEMLLSVGMFGPQEIGRTMYESDNQHVVGRGRGPDSIKQTA
jgi:hypothetical protein